MRVPRLTDQLSLFHPSPSTPQWTDLPAEVRQRVLSLLARLLRGHRRTLRGERIGREARDE